MSCDGCLKNGGPKCKPEADIKEFLIKGNVHNRGNRGKAKQKITLNGRQKPRWQTKLTEG